MLSHLFLIFQQILLILCNRGQIHLKIPENRPYIVQVAPIDHSFYYIVPSIKPIIHKQSPSKKNQGVPRSGPLGDWFRVQLNYQFIELILQMTDLRDRLIKVDSGSFHQMVEDVQAKVIQLQKLNDRLQLQVDVDQEDTKRESILDRQRKEISSAIGVIKADLQQLEKKCKGLDSVNKMNRVKKAFSKEIDRYQTIIKGLEQRSVRRSQVTDSGGHKETEHGQPQYQKQRILHQSTFSNQVEMDHQILNQNQEDVDYIEKNTHELQKAVKELAVEVNNQDQALDIIQINQFKTKENVVAATGELDQANQYSRSSKKWYCILLFLALALVIILLLVFGHQKLGF